MINRQELIRSLENTLCVLKGHPLKWDYYNDCEHSSCVCGAHFDPEVAQQELERECPDTELPTTIVKRGK